jgi:exosortase/archaeosortase family protein
VVSILIYYSKTRLRKLVILALVFPLAIASNILRAIFLVLISQQWGSEILDTEIHGASGVASFGLVIVLLYSISDMPRRSRQSA